MNCECYTQIIDFVEKRLGLKHSAMHPLIWQEKIKKRMSLLNLHSTQEYLHYIKTSSVEWQEMIELVVVSETSFFRDSSVFHFLSSLITQSKFPISFIKILSLGCSSGEEPYSIAMTFLERKVSPKSFIIDAVDISRKALRDAQIGVYDQKDYRGNHAIFCDPFFKKKNRAYEINELVRTQVNFYHGNILNHQIILQPQAYSLIFCRNLLMYLNDESQIVLLNKIKTLLAPEGFLIVGAGEMHIVKRADFLPVKIPGSFAFKISKLK